MVPAPQRGQRKRQSDEPIVKIRSGFRGLDDAPGLQQQQQLGVIPGHAENGQR
jgi:hypothetical protein